MSTFRKCEIKSLLDTACSNQNLFRKKVPKILSLSKLPIGSITQAVGSVLKQQFREKINTAIIYTKALEGNRKNSMKAKEEVPRVHPENQPMKLPRFSSPRTQPTGGFPSRRHVDLAEMDLHVARPLMYTASAMEAINQRIVPLRSDPTLRALQLSRASLIALHSSLVLASHLGTSSNGVWHRQGFGGPPHVHQLLSLPHLRGHRRVAPQQGLRLRIWLRYVHMTAMCQDARASVYRTVLDFPESWFAKGSLGSRVTVYQSLDELKQSSDF